MDTNGIIKIIVTATMCIAFLLSVGLAYLGKIDAMVVVTFVLTSFGSLLGAAGSVVLQQQGEKKAARIALGMLTAQENRKVGTNE